MLKYDVISSNMTAARSKHLPLSVDGHTIFAMSPLHIWVGYGYCDYTTNYPPLFFLCIPCPHACLHKYVCLNFDLSPTCSLLIYLWLLKTSMGWSSSALCPTNIWIYGFPALFLARMLKIVIIFVLSGARNELFSGFRVPTIFPNALSALEGMYHCLAHRADQLQHRD
jgi:hypothetical protein